MGIGFGLVLHVMFYAGGYSLFREELTVWQDSSLRSSQAAVEAPLMGSLAPLLDDPAVNTEDVFVSLPSDEHRALAVQLERRDERTTSGDDGGDERWETIYLLGPGADRAAPRSQLATILYDLHFLYHPAFPQGMYVAGGMAAVLLVAIVTGVVIHLKDLTRQLHRFRPDGSTRVVWSDAHKVLGVLGIPFQVAFAFTGAMMALAPLLLRAYVGPVFTDQAHAERTLWPSAELAPASGVVAAWLPLEELLERARAAVPGLHPDHVHIRHWRDAAGTVSMYGRTSEPFGGGAEVTVTAVDGAVRGITRSSSETPQEAVHRWIYAIHFAWFGGLPLKVLFAALAGAACVTILSGNWIWLARGGASDGAGGRHILARLTAGIGGGLPFAVGALFAINLALRLAGEPLPIAEVAAFFGTWAAAVAAAMVVQASAQTWLVLLAAAGALHIGVALADATLVGTGTLAVASERLAEVMAVNAGIAVAGCALIGLGAITRAAALRAAGE